MDLASTTKPVFRPVGQATTSFNDWGCVARRRARAHKPPTPATPPQPPPSTSTPQPPPRAPPPGATRLEAVEGAVAEFRARLETVEGAIVALGLLRPVGAPPPTTTTDGAAAPAPAGTAEEEVQLPAAPTAAESALDAAEVNHPLSPPTAAYNAVETGSLASWSADAAGKAVRPGAYHLQRKEILARKLRMQRAAPKGCFDSFAKYQDEATRIFNTGRMAF